jgi:hypothetical protein
MYTLAITLWLTASPAQQHVVYTDPMPLQTCQIVASKLSIPLLFPPEVSATASCVPPR